MRLAALLPPHPHRADVLSACALVARTRAPLADGLDRLAAGDPLLAPWSRRLGPPLRAGAPLATTLLDARLLTRREAELLARDADAPAALDRLAAGALTEPHWTWAVRHMPVAMAMALMVPGLTVALALSFLRADYQAVYRDLGVQLPLVTELTMGLGRLAAATVALIVAAATAEWALRSLRGFRHFAHLWCPEVEREHALLRLIQAARLGDDAPPTPGLLRMSLGPLALALGVIRLGAVRLGRPAWDLDWRTWLFLCGDRLSGEQRRAARAQPDLAARLLGAGVVELRDGRPDWDAAESRCRARLETAVAETLLVARPVMLAFAWMSALTIGVGTILPLVKILEELGKQ